MLFNNVSKVCMYVYAASQLQLKTQTPLFEQRAVQQKMSFFLSKLLSLEFRHCSTSIECFPDLTMAAAGSTDAVKTSISLSCTQLPTICALEQYHLNEYVLMC